MFAEREDRLGLHVLISIAIVFLLVIADNPQTFMHDLARPGAWVGIILCSAIIFFDQAFVREVVLCRYRGRNKTRWSIVAGVLTGLAFLYGLIYLFRN